MRSSRTFLGINFEFLANFRNLFLKLSDRIVDFLDENLFFFNRSRRDQHLLFGSIIIIKREYTFAYTVANIGSRSSSRTFVASRN